MPADAMREAALSLITAIDTDDIAKNGVKNIDAALEALRAALAAPSQPVASAPAAVNPTMSRDDLVAAAESIGMRWPAAAPAVPLMWQYRWTNPANDPHASEEQLAWQEVAPWNPRMQTLEQRLDELRSFRFNGVPAYEVRALYTASQAAALPPAALTDEQIRSIFLAHGFTVKPGQTDLKLYVYAAARAVESAVRAQAVPADAQAWRVIETDPPPPDVEVLLFCPHCHFTNARAHRVPFASQHASWVGARVGNARVPCRRAEMTATTDQPQEHTMRPSLTLAHSATDVPLPVPHWGPVLDAPPRSAWMDDAGERPASDRYIDPDRRATERAAVSIDDEDDGSQVDGLTLEERVIWCRGYARGHEHGKADGSLEGEEAGYVRGWFQGLKDLAVGALLVALIAFGAGFVSVHWFGTEIRMQADAGPPILARA